ncbi:MAG: 50S ribosomal protein L10 [Patescibacteria group bacterium]|nr:50S ribosomal protein L10 [Patescibacteria group bacterium]
MLKRKDKEQVVKKMSQNLAEAKSVVLTDYKGLTANGMRELRQKLQAEGASYEVFKKSLVQIAFDEAKINADIKSRKGPLALAISEEDEIAPVKIVASFAKENESLEIVGGVLENNYLSKEEMIALSKLSSKEELIAQAIGSMKAPVNNFTGILGGIIRQLIYALKAIEEQKA